MENSEYFENEQSPEQSPEESGKIRQSLLKIFPFLAVLLAAVPQDGSSSHKIEVLNKYRSIIGKYRMEMNDRIIACGFLRKNYPDDNRYAYEESKWLMIYSAIMPEREFTPEYVHPLIDEYSDDLKTLEKCLNDFCENDVLLCRDKGIIGTAYLKLLLYNPLIGRFEPKSKEDALNAYRIWEELTDIEEQLDLLKWKYLETAEIAETIENVAGHLKLVKSRLIEFCQYNDFCRGNSLEIKGVRKNPLKRRPEPVGNNKFMGKADIDKRERIRARM